MEAKSENTNESPRQGATGPGERLQAARIEKGLTIDDVASRMHLSPSILEAIEDNNFDEITAPIFVKGYLRAYARIVALSEDEMIQQYIDFYSEEDPPINSTSNVVPELSVADSRIKWTTYLVIVVLAVLLAAWWWNKQQNEEVPISLDTQSAPAVESASSDSSPVIDSDIQASSETTDDAAPAATIAAFEPVAIIETSDMNTTPALEDSSVDTDATVATAELAESEVVEPETAESETADSPSVAATVTDMAAAPVEAVAGTRAAPVRVAPAGSDRLRIVVHADTWADVKDANSYQLVYDLLRADSVVDMSGEAPFTVFLGNGHGVEVQFNDAEVNVTSRIRDDNTARLNIGS